MRQPFIVVLSLFTDFQGLQHGKLEGLGFQRAISFAVNEDPVTRLGMAAEVKCKP